MPLRKDTQHEIPRLPLRKAKRRSNPNEVATPAFSRLAMTKEQAPQSQNRQESFVCHADCVTIEVCQPKWREKNKKTQIIGVFSLFSPSFRPKVGDFLTYSDVRHYQESPKNELICSGISCVSMLK